jgi:hypothetical protein
MALVQKSAYNAPPNDCRFWIKIGKEYAKETNKLAHGSLERVFRAEIKDRLQQLEENPTGRQEGRSDYLIALDKFTQVVIAAEAAKDRRQVIQQDAALDTEAGRTWRKQQLLNPLRRTRRIADEVEIEEAVYSPIDPSATTENGRNTNSEERRSSSTALSTVPHLNVRTS